MAEDYKVTLSSDNHPGTLTCIVRARDEQRAEEKARLHWTADGADVDAHPDATIELIE